MRRIDRIPRIMKLVEEIWMIDPDFRFLQLVEMIKNKYSKSHKDAGRVQYYYRENGHEFPYNIVDLFHLEDYDLEIYLYELLEEMRSRKSDIDLFFDNMLEFFPSTRCKYNESLNQFGKRLETVVIEDIFMPEILSLLEANKHNTLLLTNVFDYLEEILRTKGDTLVNIISVTILESLGNDSIVLDKASKYMGPVTRKLQLEADKELGRLR
ncbi:DUF7674 family protein [Vallitalea okinawensis]|uniref:DUF7674 family protein n=1 Tax=Vallitalea okinawensis TaxID=2078660 RepID=UPI001FA8ADFA|nr:hypothetical protein [Vallitalea okinawensis]